MKAAGFLDTDVASTNPDFAATANAAGVFAIRVEDPANLEDAMKQAFAHPGPALLDVVTARRELAMPPETLPEAKGFSLWMLKAVLDGPRQRGDRPRPDKSRSIERSGDQLGRGGAVSPASEGFPLMRSGGRRANGPPVLWEPTFIILGHGVDHGNREK